MPGERSLYRKIHVTLEYAKERKHKSVDSLGEFIYRRSPTNFLYYWRDRETDDIKHDYSRGSINDTIMLCIDLGLMSRDGGLTQLGVTAVDPRRFPTVVGNRVSRLLAENGVDLDTIKVAIVTILRGPVPNPPTAEEIWAQIEEPEEFDFLTFKRLMNLLGECHVLLRTQKRIYLPLH